MGTPLTEERFIELLEQFIEGLDKQFDEKLDKKSDKKFDELDEKLDKMLDKKFDKKLKPINDILKKMTKYARIKNDSTIGYLPLSYIMSPCPSK